MFVLGIFPKVLGMLCKSTTGLPPNPYEIGFKNWSLVCMHVRLCPWIVCWGTIMCSEDNFADLFFFTSTCMWIPGTKLRSPQQASLSDLLVFLPHTTLSRQGLGFFFLAVYFKGNICVLIKKKITILHCRTKKMSPTIFLIYILFMERKKDSLRSQICPLSARYLEL